MTAPLKQRLLNLANAGDYEGFDLEMEAWARHCQDEIEMMVVSRFPHRTEILRDAFDAHRGGKFTLSIPTMLSQADGIGAEVFEKADYFFKGGKSNERAIENLDCRFGQLSDIFFESLRKEPAFVSRAQNVDSTINRHNVLHGRDTDYHTESNSLRTVILLGHLTDALDFINQRRQFEKELRDAIAPP